MALDYTVAFASLILIGGLSLAGMLPVELLVGIVIVTSLTSILSIVGLRTIFPLMVPSHLWERVNAIDSNGYVVATILGPPIAAGLVAFAGAPGGDASRSPCRSVSPRSRSWGCASRPARP